VIDIDPLFLWITIFTSPRFSTAPPGCTVRPYAVAKATLLAKGFYESIKLGLHLHRHLADLVEEKRPAVRRLEAPLAPLDRAGEGAALVAK
jgi:hypothetical protein